MKTGIRKSTEDFKVCCWGWKEIVRMLNTQPYRKRFPSYNDTDFSIQDQYIKMEAAVVTPLRQRVYRNV
jgi:hypothetical protein